MPDWSFCFKADTCPIAEDCDRNPSLWPKSEWQSYMNPTIDGRTGQCLDFIDGRRPRREEE